MRERGAEVRAIYGAMPRRLGAVYVLAATAEELYGLLVGGIGETDGKKWLTLAQDTRAAAEVGFLVLLKLQSCDWHSRKKIWRIRRTIFDRPRAVTIHLAWINPYNNRA